MSKKTEKPQDDKKHFDDVLKRMLNTPPDPKVNPQPEKTKPAA